MADRPSSSAAPSTSQGSQPCVCFLCGLSQELLLSFFLSFSGGYPNFSQQFPELCEEAASSQASHVQISVSASLPISLQCGTKRKFKLQSAPVDDSERYGPPVEILPHLILGCARDSSNLSGLQKLGVTAVLNVSHNVPSLFQGQLQYLEIRVPDTYQADLLSRLDEAFAFIGKIEK